MIKEENQMILKLRNFRKGNEYIEQYRNEINYSQTQIIKRNRD